MFRFENRASLCDRRRPSGLGVARLLTQARLSLFCLFWLGFQGCSLSGPKSHTLTVQIPANSASRAQASRALAQLATATSAGPQSMADFTCLGLNVVGSGITPPSNSLSCPSSSSPPGLVGGFISMTEGGTIDLTVPSGPARTIQLFAISLPAGQACPTFDSLMGLPAATRFSNLGQFYLVATTTVDVFSDQTVTLNAQFDPNQVATVFNGCPGWTPPAPAVVSTVPGTFWKPGTITAGAAIMSSIAAGTGPSGQIQAHIILGAPISVAPGNVAHDSNSQIFFVSDPNADDTDNDGNSF